MPVLIAATGGTARHSLVLDHALRPLFAHLRAVVVPTGVYAASEDWGAEGLDERIERAGGELAALMTGIARVPEHAGRSPEPVPFDQLLAALNQLPVRTQALPATEL
jgi:FMN reductase